MAVLKLFMIKVIYDTNVYIDWAANKIDDDVLFRLESRKCETIGSICYEVSYVLTKSSRDIPTCVHIVLNVEAFIYLWLGIVKYVLLPSGFSRSIEICSLSLIILKPNFSNV